MAIHTDYFVPDPRLSTETTAGRQDYSALIIKSKGGLGRSLSWEGTDVGSGIITRLNADRSIRHALSKGPDIVVLAKNAYGSWIISTKTKRVPTRELWQGVEDIANHLLAAQV